MSGSDKNAPLAKNKAVVFVVVALILLASGIVLLVNGRNPVAGVVVIVLAVAVIVQSTIRARKF